MCLSVPQEVLAIEDYVQAALIRDQIRDLDPALVLKRRLQEAILAEDYPVSLSNLHLCKDNSRAPAIAHAFSDPASLDEVMATSCPGFHAMAAVTDVLPTDLPVQFICFAWLPGIEDLAESYERCPGLFTVGVVARSCPGSKRWWKRSVLLVVHLARVRNRCGALGSPMACPSTSGVKAQGHGNGDL